MLLKLFFHVLGFCLVVEGTAPDSGWDFLELVYQWPGTVCIEGHCQERYTFEL